MNVYEVLPGPVYSVGVMDNRGVSRFWRKALACRSGAAAAEFALLLPLLMTIMMGTLQVGMMMYSYNLMVATARDTARAMAVCTITTDTGAKTNMYPNLPPWVPQGSWIIDTVFGPDVSVRVRVDITKASILSYIPFSIGQLDTYVQMKKEPLAFGGGSC